MAIEIKNPKAPITSNPITETFNIVLNSSIVGFFNSRQTRRYLLYCAEICRVNLVAMLITNALGF